MQIVGGRFATLTGPDAAAVLMDDHAAKNFHAIRQPERVSDAHLQFAGPVGGGVFDAEIFPGGSGVRCGDCDKKQNGG